MNHRSLLGAAIGLTLVVSFLFGCGLGAPQPPAAAPAPVAPAATFTPVPPTATPTPVPPTATPTPVPPTPTPTPLPELTLYLCDSADRQRQILAEKCQMAGISNVQKILYPQYPDSQVDFEYNLPGDIQGTSYTLSLWFASGDTTTFDVSIVLRQGGNETVLGSTSFTAVSRTFKQFSATLTAPDPTTHNGDVLILRIFPADGVDGAVTFTDSQYETSFVKIPAISPSGEPETAEGATATAQPEAIVTPTSTPKTAQEATATARPEATVTPTVTPTSTPKAAQGATTTAQLEVTHSPNPAKFQAGGASKNAYTCAYKTSVKAIGVGVRIEGFGMYFWENGQWVHSPSNNGRPWSPEDFADWYSCPGAYIKPGQVCADPNNWNGSNSLELAKGKWYYKGVDDNGHQVEGEAIIECQP